MVEKQLQGYCQVQGKYIPIVEKLVTYDGKLCVEATHERARPYCKTDWFYKAPNYTAYRYADDC